MEPKDIPQQSTSTLSLRALLSAALILLLSLALSGTFEYLRSRDHAAQQASELSLMFGRSSAILIQPLVLADDRISLNYLFNELAGQPMINGLRLTAPDQTLIALAGQPQGRGHTLELAQGDEVIGQLTLWSNAQPFAASLHQQLYEIALLLAGSLGITAILIGFSLKQRTRLDAPEAPSFGEVARQVVNRDSIPEFDFSQPPEQASSPAPDKSPAEKTEVKAEDKPAPVKPAPAPKPASDDIPALDLPPRTTAPEPPIVPESRVAEAPEKPLTEAPRTAETPARPAEAEFETEPSLSSTSDSAVHFEPEEEAKTEPEPEPALEPVPSQAATSGRREPSFDTDDLVSLLKPEQAAERMPRFTPKPVGHVEDDDSDEAMVPDMELTELDSSPRETLDESQDDSDNPLRLSDEEQLGLYTFEQELEMLLTPEEAGYLFLIDTRSAHSENLDGPEREALLKNYRTLANSVARIYSGRLEALKDGNLRILFTQSDDKDSHGVNAICCAMLFTYLYQHYNQQQIRAFQPVMNLHMSLVRGALDKVERMQEEAHFLSRTTQSNALISHTALTEAPLLKESLLSQADIRREDEDKVLLLAVNESYQNLLEKQARHLLTKLAERSKAGN